MTDIRQAAHEYLDAGWELVRIKHGEKLPAGQWRKEKPKATDFEPGDDIALKCGAPSGDRICVDADCPEAIALLPRFLSSDNAHVEGRASKPRSHWWIHAPNVPTRHYKDVDGTALIDVISTGGYAVAPPSVHVSGETRGWVEPRPTLTVFNDTAMVSYLAVATLLARHWPSSGARHDLVGPLAGLLLRCALPDIAVSRIIEEAMRVAGDTEVADRLKYVHDTIARFKAGERVTGGPRVAEIIGLQAKSKICSFLDAADFSILDDLNKRWFICDVGAETVVGEEVEETNEEKTRRWTRLSFRSFSAFRERLVKLPDICIGYRQNGAPIMQSAADYWLEHDEGRQYDRLVYAPPGSGIGCDTAKNPPDLNGWKGFTVEPQPGDWSKTRDFIKTVVCNDNQALFDWFLDWCAAMFQRPGEHADTVPVLTGEQGIGKNFLFDQVLGWCFDGRHAATVVNLNGVLGPFTEKLSGLVLLTLDEVQMSSAESVAMRGLVTGGTLDINRKHIARASELNMLHIAILSNNDAPVRIDSDDRRFAFFAVSNKRKKQHAFFADLISELDERGGRAAMLYDLLHRKYDRHALREAPSTSAKQYVKARSLSEQQNALRHWLLQESLIGELEVVREDLFNALRGQRHQPDEPGWTDDALGKLVRSIWPTLPQDTKRRVQRKEKRTYKFGLVSDARARFDMHFGIVTDWPSTKMDDLVDVMKKQTFQAVRTLGTVQQIHNTAVGLLRFGTTLLRKIGQDVSDLDEAVDKREPPIDDSACPF